MARMLRFKFSRDESLKYIAHLDVLRLFERATKRARLPVAYTQGFNPRQKLVFGLPMSIGLTSEAEYADIELEEELSLQDFISRMNEGLPRGIRVLEAVEQKNKGNIMNQITAARYEIHLKTPKAMSLYEMDTLIQSLLEREDISVMKKTKKGPRPVNIRPMIYTLSALKTDIDAFCLEAFLSAGAENNLRVDLLMEAFEQETGLKVSILRMHRKALYTSTYNEWKNPFEVANG